MTNLLYCTGAKHDGLVAILAGSIPVRDAGKRVQAQLPEACIGWAVRYSFPK